MAVLNSQPAIHNFCQSSHTGFYLLVQDFNLLAILSKTVRPHGHEPPLKQHPTCDFPYRPFSFNQMNQFIVSSMHLKSDLKQFPFTTLCLIWEGAGFPLDRTPAYPASLRLNAATFPPHKGSTAIISKHVQMPHKK